LTLCDPAQRQSPDGGKDQTVHNIKQTGALVGNVGTGGAGGYHVSVSNDGKDRIHRRPARATVAIPLSPFGAGTQINLSGDDNQLTTVAFDSGGHGWYTISGYKGVGAFGQINLQTGTTKRLINNLPAAHGMVFDSFSNTLILAAQITLRRSVQAIHAHLLDFQ